MNKNQITIKAIDNKQSIALQQSNTKNTVDLSANSAQYWSNIAKQWAIKENELVINEDYSAKYYAGKSRESAEIATVGAATVENLTTQLNNDFTRYSNDLQEISTEAMQQINNATSGNVQDITSAKENALTEISTTSLNSIAQITEEKLSALENIDTAKNEALEDIEDAGDQQVARINSTGQSYENVTHRNVTNCILEAPQRINLSLSNGTLTLKAGSRVIVPDGPGVFKKLILEADLSRSNFPTTQGRYFIAGTYNASTGKVTQLTAISLLSQSGSTPPTNGIYYNLTENKIISYTNGVAQERRTFPIAIVQCENEVPVAIEQVFQNSGYFGSTFLLDEGVTGLIPTYRNSDGSLKNTKYTTTAIKTFTTEAATISNMLGFCFNNGVLGNSSIASYNEEMNINIKSTGELINGFPFCSFSKTNGLINRFTGFHSLNLVNRIDLDKLKTQVPNVCIPNYNGVITIPTTSLRYNPPSNGLICFNIPNNSGSSCSITIGQYNAYIGRQGADDSAGRWLGLSVSPANTVTWTFTGTVNVRFIPYIGV